MTVVLEALALERAHVAKQLHKGPSQVLTALQLHLGTTNGLASAEAESLLDQLAHSLRSTSEQLACPADAPLAQSMPGLAGLARRYLGIELDSGLLEENAAAGTSSPALLRLLRTLLIATWQDAPQVASLSVHQRGSSERLMLEVAPYADSHHRDFSDAHQQAESMDSSLHVEVGDDRAAILIALAPSTEHTA